MRTGTRRGRYANLRRIESLDPSTQFREIYRITSTLEFPWDVTQALGLALYRTYAVPSIGDLLARTGEFTDRTQQRYDDTGLILDAVAEHGPGIGDGRTALRRMNRMHAGYVISNDDMRYVLSTFVVVPMRWLQRCGWRSPSAHELAASANYYRELGRHMAIADIPADYDAFAAAMDAYEAQWFAYGDGGRAVADATLELMTTFPPFDRLPAALVRRTSRTLLDGPLLDALGYPRPSRAEAALVAAGLRARALVLRRLAAPRTEPVRFRDLPQVRSYPDGFDVADLGPVPAGCPRGGGRPTRPAAQPNSTPWASGSSEE